MAIPIYLNIVSGLFNKIHTLLHQYVNNGYVALVDALRYPLGIAVTLYIVLLGYSISQGWVKLSINEFVKVSIKIGLIYTFAMNWDFFSANVVGFIQEGSNQLGGIIFHATTHSSVHYGANGIEAALQNILIQFTKLGFWFWKRGNMYSPTPYFEAMVVWASGISLLLIAMFQLILANVMLSLLFVAAPLFIGFTLFRPTHALFDRWLGNVVSSALLIFFISVVLGFVLSITNWVVSGINEKNLLSLTVVSFVPILLVVLIGIGLIKRVAEMVRDIGMAISTLSSSSEFAVKISSYAAPIISVPTQLVNESILNPISSDGMYVALRSRLRRGERE